MDRLKKLNGSMIAAIVLSVLLIMSVTSGATLAWFGSRDAASASLTMGEAIVVTVGEDYKQGEGKLAMSLPVTQGGLVPGMSVTPNIKVQLQKSNTNALVRARFITTVEYPNNYIDAAYSNTTKYPDKNTTDTTTTGRVLDTAAFPNDHVYAGDMYYDYYNYLGHRYKPGYDPTDNVADTTFTQTEYDALTDEDDKHSKKIHLSRVKVRDAIVNQIGKTGEGAGWQINGIKVAVTADNAAELEIRQRGVDLTEAINRVLQGQGGYSVNSATGDLIEGGIKYTRRVADGWAYREADQAWYYLGSQTNGFVIADNTEGDSEDVDTTKPIAKDIASYSTTTVGNKTVQTPNYTLLSDAGNPYKTESTTNGSNTNDMARNYLGGTFKDYSIDRVANEIGVLNQATVASVDLSQGDVSIDFLTKRFVLPTFINNDYALAKVRFDFTVEAVQDYLVDPIQEATAAADRLPNNLVNAILVFNNAFPQTLYPHTTVDLDKVRATGSTANILPGGGDNGVGSPEWMNDENGTTTILYNNTGTTEGDRYSYGFLSNARLGIDADAGAAVGASGKATEVTGTYAGGTEYEYVVKYDTNNDSKVDENDKLKTKSMVLGFGVKEDEYGDYVADYTKVARYVRGTASSLGICPFVEGRTGSYTPPAPTPTPGD